MEIAADTVPIEPQALVTQAASKQPLLHVYLPDASDGLNLSQYLSTRDSGKCSFSVSGFFSWEATLGECQKW